jgi:transcriptional regulator with XRE-family HTH domain
MTINEEFGKVLNKYRTRKGKTQADLARSAGLDRTYISLLELGKRSPTLDTIVALCRALDAIPSELLKTMEELLDARDHRS